MSAQGLTLRLERTTFIDMSHEFDEVLLMDEETEEELEEELGDDEDEEELEEELGGILEEEEA